MKKLFILSLFLFLSQTILLAQNPLIFLERWNQVETGILGPSSKLSFEYTASGEQSITISENWNLEQKKYVPSSRTLYSYNLSNQISKIEIQSPQYPDTFFTFYSKKYFYNENCLTKNITINYNNGIQGNLTERTDYYNPSTCKIDSTKIIYNNEYFNFYTNSLRIYSHSENIEIEEYYIQDTLDLFSPDPVRRITRIYDEQDRVINITNINLLPDIDQVGGSSEYEYDENGNETLVRNYDIFSDTILPTIFYQTEYIYNESQQILSSNYSSISTSGVTTPLDSFEYEYSCDGLLKKRTQVSYPLLSTSVYYYSHLHGYDCKEENDEESEDLISIRPNFTQDFVLVESKILRSAKSKLAIYDMSGRRIMFHSITEGVENYYLYLGDLIPGNYIIHIFDQQQSAAKRVLKF